MSTYKTIPGFNDRYEVSETGDVRWTNHPAVAERFHHKPLSFFRRNHGRVYTLTAEGKKTTLTEVRAIGLAFICPDKSKCFKLMPGKPVHAENIIALGSPGETNFFGKRKSEGKTSSYRGVYWHRRLKKFAGTVTVKGERHLVSASDDEKEVALAVDKLLLEVAPDAHISRLNFPELVKKGK